MKSGVYFGRFGESSRIRSGGSPANGYMPSALLLSLFILKLFVVLVSKVIGSNIAKQTVINFKVK